MLRTVAAAATIRRLGVRTAYLFFFSSGYVEFGVSPPAVAAAPGLALSSMQAVCGQELTREGPIAMQDAETSGRDDAAVGILSPEAVRILEVCPRLDALVRLVLREHEFPPTEASAARRMSMSVGAFRSVFPRYFGLTLRDFVILCRFDRIRAVWADPLTKLSALARRSGFHSTRDLHAAARRARVVAGSRPKGVRFERFATIPERLGRRSSRREE